MRKASALLLAVATSSALVAAGGVASAAPATYAQPTVESISSTVLASSANGGFALVQARYTCYGGDEGTHLFIAVKQGPDVSPENASASPTTTAFYSTNYNSDGPGLSLHCDGATHTQTFRLKNDPYWWNTAAAPRLTSGPALVQFCLFDSTSSEGSESGFTLDYEMKTVRVLH
jgi:hypothetical protein